MIGWGHIFRSLSLACELASDFERLVLFTRTTDALPRPLQLQFGSRIERILLEPRTHPRIVNNTRISGASKFELEDAEMLRRGLSRTSPRVLVLDHYLLSTNWASLVENSVGVVVQISDRPTLVGNQKVIDYGFDAKPSKYADADEGQLFLGPAFFPAPPVRNLGSFSRFRPGSVLASLGGSSQGHLQDQVEGLHLQQKFSFSLSFLSRVIQSEGQPNSVRLGANPDNAASFGETLQKFELAITGGGVTSYEALAAGKLAAVVRTAENQINSLSGLANFRGDIMQVEPSSIQLVLDEANRLLELPEPLKRERALEQRALVDLLGSKRVRLRLDTESLKQVQLRDACQRDIAITFRWANDPRAREASLDNRLIPASKHIEWFNQSILGGKSKVYVAEVQSVPVGLVRFEPMDRAFRLSYSVDPDFRGNGISKRMLRLALSKLQSSVPIFAQVKGENIASRKILEALGFEILDASSLLVTYQRQPTI